MLNYLYEDSINNENNKIKRKMVSYEYQRRL